MNLTQLLRMARWARHPPSRRRVIIVSVAVALCLTLAGAEWLGLFPEHWGIDPGRRSFRP
ncbi:hypothetical protein DEA8626_01306 [Defluviimonas aquaemixtae]|uniref:Uncharacterized protein n=1 Tax=Albidovulum aquaemixtae TaxID=1542388 RepID=A0A2R8B594_9RHOB|nr:hypothetical protein [Defluviimonas aquaemixtae]SPH17779.1 hypothetical protein DEA8626_01306 [Defluviimonas aquaemixtae]